MALQERLNSFLNWVSLLGKLQLEGFLPIPVPSVSNLKEVTPPCPGGSPALLLLTACGVPEFQVFFCLAKEFGLLLIGWSNNTR